MNPQADCDVFSTEAREEPLEFHEGVFGLDKPHDW
jgi:hypothetical protein